MNKSVTLAALVLLCTLLPAAGQAIPPRRADEADDVVKITTSLVQVDAVVTKDGKPVPGLTANDFEIYEDGKRQTITSFAYISNVAGAATPANDKTNTFVPPARVKRDVSRRIIAIVVDD